MSAKRISKDESRKNEIYNKAIKEPVNEKSFLFEAGQGQNANGNIFALIDSIRHEQRFDDYRVYLSLVPERTEAWKKKADKYGIKNVCVLEFGSDEYLQALGTSKYLITDNSFPAYFFKRKDQVYLNTWHGTPLKRMGRADIQNAISIANVQANMAKADWLLHPNRYTKDIMMSDYMMERVFKHKTVIMDYPRNDALYSERFAEEIRNSFGVHKNRIIAYMPTWRGTGRDISSKGQINQFSKVIDDLSNCLEEDDVLLVNLHFVIKEGLDLERYDNVYAFPVEYETYDVLAACDTLITDYSSVSIDFAGTGRDIILYMFDYEKYEKEKGFYFDIRKLPFKQAFNNDELRKRLSEPKLDYALDTAFTCDVKGDVSKRILDLIMSNEGSDLDIEDYSINNDINIAYFENINSETSINHIRNIEAVASEDSHGRITLMFPNVMDERTINTLNHVDKRIDFIRVSGRLYCSNGEFKKLWVYRKLGLCQKAANEIYEREAMRQMGQFKFRSIEMIQGNNPDRTEIINRLNKGNHNEYYKGI